MRVEYAFSDYYLIGRQQDNRYLTNSGRILYINYDETRRMDHLS